MDLKKEWKEAIETLKEVASDDFDTLGDDISPKMAQNILNVIDKQQKEIEELQKDKKVLIKNYDKVLGTFISKDKIMEKLKELEEQKEKMKYDGNRSFADYEQYCKNLKFFKEQIEELLK